MTYSYKLNNQAVRWKQKVERIP